MMMAAAVRAPSAAAQAPASFRRPPPLPLSSTWSSSSSLPSPSQLPWPLFRQMGEQQQLLRQQPQPAAAAVAAAEACSRSTQRRSRHTVGGQCVGGRGVTYANACTHLRCNAEQIANAVGRLRPSPSSTSSPLPWLSLHKCISARSSESSRRTTRTLASSTLPGRSASAIGGGEEEVEQEEEGGDGEGGGMEEWTEEELDELFDQFGKVVKSDEDVSEDSNGGGATTAAVVVEEAASTTAAAAAAAIATAAAAGADDDSEALAVALAKVASDTKAGDILVLNVAPLVYWTQFFVVATAFSRPQMDAMAARMTALAEGENFGRAARGDGQRVTPGPWTLLDYGDVVVHLFAPRERERYRIEEFYANAEVVPLPFE